ncbi:MAG: hypothetical protein OXG15_03630 [Gammaproteobacteria bacterium]|nr:hypothetical protein [Gammaproteobacteria bacterium]
MLSRVIAWSAFIVWLRSYWRSSTWFAPFIVAAIAIAVITFGHGEYLEFAAASQATQHVALSFVMKWGSIAAIALIALLVILRKRRKKEQSASAPIQNEQIREEPSLPHGVDLDRPRSAAERILDESPP